MMFGDAQDITRHDPVDIAAFAVDFDAVAAAEVTYLPVAVDEVEFAVMGRDIGKAQGDIATSSSSDEEGGFE